MSCCSSFSALRGLLLRCLLALFTLSTALLGFASRVPTWRLLVSELGIVDGGGVEVGDEEVHWVSGSGPGRKKFDRKPPAHLVGRSVNQSRPRVWKRLRHV